MSDKNNINKIIYIGISIILLILLALTSMKIGSIDITIKELINGIFINSSKGNMGIIRDLRMPRVLIAILAGANLAVSGVLLQSIIKNPLADPSVTGISSGATLATIVIMVLFPSLSKYRFLFGFLGGLLACIIVYLLAFKNTISPMRIILAGIAVNSILGGIATMLTIFNGTNSLSIQMWLCGSLMTVTWKDVNSIFFNTVIGLMVAFSLFKACNVIILGDKNAKSLGFNADLLRVIISLVAVFLAGISTSIVGIIAFIGLVVPHICRILIGYNHKYLIPFSCVMGSILLLIADTLGRTLAKPYEIPVGIVMAVIGGPFFLYLLRRSKV